MKKFLKNKKIICIIVIIFLIGLYIIINKLTNNYNEEIITTEESNIEAEEDNEIDVVTESSENSEDENNESEEEDKKIYVYVTGEVNNPGVVILNKGSRITDAINAAGGTTSKANTTKVNLVYILEDGMKVNIPSKEEANNGSNFEYITKDSGEGAGDSNISNRSSSSVESSDRAEEVGTTKKERSSSIVNINTATQTELETLPGIGPSTALKIINYRKETGKFSNIEELKNVNGIGDSKFETLKKFITV